MHLARDTAPNFSALFLRAPFSFITRVLIQGVLVLLAGIILVLLVLFKSITSPQFEAAPLLFSYTFFVVLFQLSRLIAATLYPKTRSDIYVTIPAGYEPSVSIIIPCKNEEMVIADTVAHAFGVAYPQEKLEVIVIDDGSTDHTYERLQELHTQYPRLRVIRWGENRGKRAAMAEGFRHASGEIVVQLDSDSYVEARSFRNLITPFAHAEIGALCAHTHPANMGKNIITKMQAAYYFMSFRILKAAEASFLTVLCCSGCAAAYRRSAVLPILEHWVHETFLGRPVTWGDDRALTSWVLKSGYQTFYTDRVVAYTLVPTTFSGLVRQQIRWKKSWVVNAFLTSGFLFRTRPFVSVFYFFPLIFISLASPFMAFYSVMYQPLVTARPPLFYLTGIFLISSLFIVYYRIVSRNRYWLYLYLWFFAYLTVFTYLFFIAIVRLQDRRWGTR